MKTVEIAYDFIEIVKSFNKDLPRREDEIKIENCRRAKLCYERLQSLDLCDPELFFTKIDDEYQDPERYIRLNSQIIRALREYTFWFTANRGWLFHYDTRKRLRDEADQEGHKEFDGLIETAQKEFIHWAEGDMAKVRPFTRLYGFWSGQFDKMPKAEFDRMVDNAYEMRDYFNLHFIIPDQFHEQYMWFEEKYKPEYLRLMKARDELYDKRRECIYKLCNEIDIETFLKIYDLIAPYDLEVPPIDITAKKARGEHGTPKNVTCLKDCFINHDDYLSFIDKVNEFCHRNTLTGNDAACAYCHLKEETLLVLGVSQSRFLQYLHEELPTKYTRKSNTNVTLKGTSKFVAFLKEG